MDGEGAATRSHRQFDVKIALMSERLIRWWPLTGLGLLLAVALVVVWGFGEQTGQDRVMSTLVVVVIGLLLALIWLLVLSRLPWRRRLFFCGLVALLGVLLASTLRIRGVNGDLVPILGWRWAGGGGESSAGGGGRLTGPVGDYPQFLGPGRSAKVAGISLARGWSEPPSEVWRRSVGEGWSAFAVSGTVAVTQEQRGGEELVVAYELESGRQLWAHADAARYETTIAGIGPRATPTITDGRVFTHGALGRLNALQLATGERLWTHDLATEFNSSTPDWGRSGSPLAVDDLVVVNVGGGAQASLLAFDAVTGELAWSAGDDALSYSSPTLLTLAGRRQIVVFNRGSVAGHDVESGRVLWSYPWSAEQPNVALPVAIGDDRLLVSSGYGQGAKLLRLVPEGDGLRPELVWESPRLKAKFTNVVVHDGYVYGLDDGVLVCLDPETGERCWKRGRYGHGQVILVDDLLLVQTEGGDVVLVEPSPEAHRELARFTALDGKSWNPPALAGRYLLLRNDAEAVLYELPLAG